MREIHQFVRASTCRHIVQALLGTMLLSSRDYIRAFLTDKMACCDALMPCGLLNCQVSCLAYLVMSILLESINLLLSCVIVVKYNPATVQQQLSQLSCQLRPSREWTWSKSRSARGGGMPLLKSNYKSDAVVDHNIVRNALFICLLYN